MEKTLTTTSFMLFGVIGFSVFGIQTVVFFTILAVILSTFDILTGFLRARKKGEVNSLKMGEGVIKKCVLIFTVLLIQVVLWHISYILEQEWISIIGLLVIVWYVATEFVSIIENINDMGLNKYEAKLFTKLHHLSQRVLNKIEGKVEDKTTSVLGENNNLKEKKEK